jgi:hypothetical protein
VLVRRVLPFVVLALATGCGLKNREIVAAPLPFASVNYTVLGPTSADACGIYVLGIDFGHLVRDRSAKVSGGSILGLRSRPNAEERRALYDALDKMPEATNLYAPRFEDNVTGFSPFGVPVFGQRCASVVAHGVQLGSGPVPNAQ